MRYKPITPAPEASELTQDKYPNLYENLLNISSTELNKPLIYEQNKMFLI